MRCLNRNMMKFTLSFVMLLLLATSAFGITVNMVAEKATVTMPDAQVIQMWGFRDVADGAHAAGDWKIPTISTVAGDSLTINLSNNIQAPGLVEPVSIIIPGQKATEAGALVPEFFNDGDDDRVFSFTHSTASLDSDTYEWNNLRAGTYLIQSGTHPAVQMQMGLYAVLKVDEAAGEAYPGVLYDSEATLLFSEIDPVLHEAVSLGVYGDPNSVVPSTGLPMTSTMEYDPAYYLINGQPYLPGDAAFAPGSTGQSVLLRFLNAGLQNRVPVLQGAYMTLIAEDGYRKGFDLEQYSVFLSPSKTMDAIITSMPAGSLPIYDRRLDFNNFSGAGGGMLAFLNAVPSTPLTVISPNGGEQIKVGSSFNVRWSPQAGATRYRASYFDVDGTEHSLVNANVTDYIWSVPTDAVAEAGKTFRVLAFDGTNTRIGLDWADGPFTILPSVLTVVAPNGGEVFTAGTTTTIQWEAQSNAVRYRASYFDADGTEHAIVNSNVTSFAWTIPLNAVAEAGKTFRVVAFDATNTRVGVDWAEGTFTIEPAPGTVLAPNGGEIYSIAGPAVNLQWLAHPDAVRYRASYFDVDGTEHTLVNDNVTSFSWTIPGTAVVEAGKTFRVIAFDATNTRVSVDWANGAFEITP